MRKLFPIIMLLLVSLGGASAATQTARWYNPPNDTTPPPAYGQTLIYWQNDSSYLYTDTLEQADTSRIYTNFSINYCDSVLIGLRAVGRDTLDNDSTFLIIHESIAGPWLDLWDTDTVFNGAKANGDSLTHWAFHSFTHGGHHVRFELLIIGTADTPDTAQAVVQPYGANR